MYFWDWEASVWVAELLALPTLDHEVSGSKPAGGGIELVSVWSFIAQNLPLSTFPCLDMIYIPYST